MAYELSEYELNEPTPVDFEQVKRFMGAAASLLGRYPYGSDEYMRALETLPEALAATCAGDVDDQTTAALELASDLANRNTQPAPKDPASMMVGQHRSSYRF